MADAVRPTIKSIAQGHGAPPGPSHKSSRHRITSRRRAPRRLADMVRPKNQKHRAEGGPPTRATTYSGYDRRSALLARPDQAEMRAAEAFAAADLRAAAVPVDDPAHDRQAQAVAAGGAGAAAVQAQEGL